MNFTKKRFLSFSSEKQHKKCSELLKIIYEGLIDHQPTDDLLDHYHEIQQWMNSEKQVIPYFEQISNAYHYHLTSAKQQHQEHNLLPNVKKIDRNNGKNTWPIAIYLDHIRSAHNVGSIIRTVEAFSLGTIYFSDNTPFIDNKQVKDASMGSHAWTTCLQNKDYHALPKPLVALETSTDAISLNEFIFPQEFTLAVGNEEYGCSDELLKAADYIIEIPLRGRKNSLNVANAFAIAANEIQRQKGKL